MAYLIVGSEGFIGSAVKRHLLEKTNENIYGIDTKNKEETRGEKAYKYCRTISEIKQDLHSEQYLRVIHCAYSTSHLLPKSAIGKSIGDIEELANLLEALYGHEKVKFFYLSSSAVYKTGQKYINEGCLVSANNPYSFMKLTCESMLEYYSSITEFDVTIFRLFTCYGLGQNPETLFGKLLKSRVERKAPVVLKKNGSQIRDFLHVDDIVSALVDSIIPKGFNCYNLSGNNPIKLRQLACMMNASVVYEGEDDPEDISIGVSEKLLNESNWKPKINLEQGLQDLRKALDYLEREIDHYERLQAEWIESIK